METIPNLFEERTHDLEVYATKKIYNQLKLLNKLPMNQNAAGAFTNYVSADPSDVIGDVITTGDGLDFNEIQFGEPSTVRGATIAKGYMFKMNSRLEDQGKMDSTLQVFMNKAVTTLANFYDKTYITSLANGAGATEATGLNTIDSDATGIDVLENELKIIDSMEVKSDIETGFTPTTVLLPRADATAIKIALAKSNLLDDSNFEYIPVPSSILSSGQKLVLDLNNPCASIEKFADPDYSIIAELEQEPEMNAELLMELPKSFINVKMTEPNEPQRSYIYVWAESNVNILEGNGIMFIDPQ